MSDTTLRFRAKHWSVKVLPIDLCVPPQKVAIFTLKNRTLSPPVKLFIECARQVVGPLAKIK
jgi:hypothetical protein